MWLPLRKDPKPRREILVLDFDGVVHSYRSGWKGARHIPDPPMPGAARFILEALGHFDVAVSSSRSHQWGGRGAMRAYIGAMLHAEAMQHLMEPWLPYRVREVFNHNPMEPAEHIDWLLGGLLRYPLFKPPAKVTIDDRAITFRGNWPDPKALLDFKPWRIDEWNDVPGPVDEWVGKTVKVVDSSGHAVKLDGTKYVVEEVDAGGASHELTGLRFVTRSVPVPSSFAGGPGADERRVFLQQWVWLRPHYVPDAEGPEGRWEDVPGQDKGFVVKP